MKLSKIKEDFNISLDVMYIYWNKYKLVAQIVKHKLFERFNNLSY